MGVTTEIQFKNIRGSQRNGIWEKGTSWVVADITGKSVYWNLEFIYESTITVQFCVITITPP